MVGEEVGIFAGWHLHRGTDKTTKEPVSIFRFVKKDEPAARVALAENALVRARALRHPHLLGFVDGASTDSEIRIVTPPVVPLGAWLDAQRAAHGGAGAGRRGGGAPAPAAAALDGAVAWGLYAVSGALAFLHAREKLHHGNVSMASVFVAPDGDWKLGGLGLCGGFAGVRLVLCA